MAKMQVIEAHCDAIGKNMRLIEEAGMVNQCGMLYMKEHLIKMCDEINQAHRRGTPVPYVESWTGKHLGYLRNAEYRDGKLYAEAFTNIEPAKPTGPTPPLT